MFLPPGLPGRTTRGAVWPQDKRTSHEHKQIDSVYEYHVRVPVQCSDNVRTGRKKKKPSVQKPPSRGKKVSVRRCAAPETSSRRAPDGRSIGSGITRPRRRVFPVTSGGGPTGGAAEISRVSGGRSRRGERITKEQHLTRGCSALLHFFFSREGGVPEWSVRGIRRAAAARGARRRSPWTRS